jgi:putative ABC transport system substrate-binding protein
MNIRRKLLIALGAGALAIPLRSFAQQQGKVWRIGFFYFGSRQSALDTGRYQMFQQGMRGLGYEEGKNLVIEARYADGRPESLAGLATELARSNVDVIVATGGAVYDALKKAAVTIPTVITVSADPVGDGLAKSLARPGGNLTGLTENNAELIPKHLELLRIAVPTLSRVAVLVNPANGGHDAQLKRIEAIAPKIKVHVMRADSATIAGIERSFDTIARERARAIIILNDTFFVQQIGQIANLAAKHRLASIAGTRDFPEAGGLMGYGGDIADNFRRAATYVDKILKGAKPGDLPIEQPTRYFLTINRKTANTIGLKIPSELLLRADKVIE